MVSYKFSMFLPQNETKTHHIIFTQRKCVRKNAGRVCGNRRWTNPNTANWMNLRFAVKRFRLGAWHIIVGMLPDQSVEKYFRWKKRWIDILREKIDKEKIVESVGIVSGLCVCCLVCCLLMNDILFYTQNECERKRERERAFHWQNGKMESVQFAAY